MLQLLSRNVDLSGDCFAWTGAKTEGYGRIKHSGKDMLAHRASYIFFRGEVPGDLFVCHGCDNPACIRPDHLFLGTVKENAEDCFRKDRTAHGEKNHHHRITAEIAAEIYEACKAGLISQRAIAEKYNIDQSEVSRIKTGIRWWRATGAPDLCR